MNNTRIRLRIIMLEDRPSEECKPYPTMESDGKQFSFYSDSTYILRYNGREIESPWHTGGMRELLSTNSWSTRYEPY